MLMLCLCPRRPLASALEGSLGLDSLKPCASDMRLKRGQSPALHLLGMRCLEGLGKPRGIPRTSEWPQKSRQGLVEQWVLRIALRCSHVKGKLAIEGCPVHVIENFHEHRIAQGAQVIDIVPVRNETLDYI